MRFLRGPAVGLTVLLALCALPSLAAAETGQISLAANDDTVVLTLDLRAGEWVDYTWSANASVDFRLENSGGTTTFVDRAGQVGSGAYQATADGSYRFEFRNRNSSAVGGQWTITKRADSTPLILLMAALLAAALVVGLVLRARRAKQPSTESPPPPQQGN